MSNTNTITVRQVKHFLDQWGLTQEFAFLQMMLQQAIETDDKFEIEKCLDKLKVPKDDMTLKQRISFYQLLTTDEQQ